MADVNLTDIFSAVGYHLGNLVGEVRGKRDREYNAMASAVVRDPSLADVPKFRSTMKHYGWQDADFEALKAHRAVSNIAALLQTVDQTTQRGPAQAGRPVMGSMGGVAGGAGANMSAAPSARIALPPSAIPQAPAPTGAPPQSRAQALAGRMPPGSVLNLREGGREGGQSLQLRGPAQQRESGPSGFAKLQADREAAVLRGDYRAAAELDQQIKVKNIPPAEAAAARTTAVEQAKLDPALVAQKLSVKDRENLRKIAPNATLKALQHTDGKAVTAGSLTNEQVLAMTHSGELVPKESITDKVAADIWDTMFGGNNPFRGGGSTGAGSTSPSGGEAGISWDDDPTVTVKPAH